jgi:hypothetical protein
MCAQLYYLPSNGNRGVEYHIFDEHINDMEMKGRRSFIGSYIFELFFYYTYKMYICLYVLNCCSNSVQRGLIKSCNNLE